MKKLLVMTAAVIAAALMSVPVFGAELEAVTKESARKTASRLVPEDSVFQYTEQCREAFEVVYYSEGEKTYYAVGVSVFSGEVLSVSSVAADDKGSREAVLSEEQVKEIVASDAGDGAVAVDAVALDTVAGRKKYEVQCTGEGFEVRYAINPENGRILEKKIRFSKPEN